MLSWFDAEPARYWALAWTAFAGFLLATLGPLAAERWPALRRLLPTRFFSPGWFGLALVLAFFAFRWPLFFLEAELNPDESQMIAGAITLQHDPIFWRSVDGGTHGPLADYPLLLGRLLFLPLNYGGARVVGALLMLGVIFAVHRLLVRAFGEAVARVALLPLFCFLAFLSYWDLCNYSSEHVPALLLMLGATLVGWEIIEAAPGRTWSPRWVLAGVFLGAAPLAKLQAGPIAAVLAGTAVLLDALNVPTWRARFARLGSLTVGAMTVPLVFMLLALGTGTLGYAWETYLYHNLTYAGERHYPVATMIANFWNYAGIVEGLLPFLVGGAIFVTATVISACKPGRPTGRLLPLAFMFLGISFLAVVFPGRRFMHYLLLLVPPSGLLLAVLFGVSWQHQARASGRVALFLAFIGCTVVPQVWARSQLAHPFVGQLVAVNARRHDAVVQKIWQYAQPGEPLGQWGWMPRYYVAAQMPHATIDAISQRAIDHLPMRGFFRGHYLRTLQASAPPVFIDTVGPGNFGNQSRADAAHEIWPELTAYLSTHYTQVADVTGTRIYVSNERLAARMP